MSKYRQNKIKQEHTIIEGGLAVLEGVSACSLVSAIIPARIRCVKNSQAPLTLQYETDTGLKMLLFSRTAVQEVFVVTGEPERVIRWLVREGLIASPDDAPGEKPENEEGKNKKKQSGPGRKRRSRKAGNRQRGRPDRERVAGANGPMVYGNDESMRPTLGDSIDRDVLAKLQALLKEEPADNQLRSDVDAKTKNKPSTQKAKPEKAKATPQSPLEAWLDAHAGDDKKAWKKMLRRYKDDADSNT